MEARPDEVCEQKLDGREYHRKDDYDQKEQVLPIIEQSLANDGHSHRLGHRVTSRLTGDRILRCVWLHPKSENN